jgi:fluoride exporter
MTTWIAVLLGGALGSVARHGVNVITARLVGAPSPWATAAVNMIGAVVIGVLAGALAANRLSMSRPLQAFVFVGILGGFTTFSSFMLDSLTLSQSGELAKAAVNLIGQVSAGLVLTYVGYQAGLRLLS